MSPTQAISHLKFRLGSEKILVNKKDVQAFNSMVIYIDSLKHQAINDNKMLAKMIINEFIWQTRVHNKTSTSAINQIDKILKMSVWNWALELKKTIPLLKLKRLSESKGISVDRSDVSKIVETNNILMKEYSKELSKAFTEEYTDKELEEFINDFISDLIIKNQNLD